MTRLVLLGAPDKNDGTPQILVVLTPDTNTDKEPKKILYHPESKVVYIFQHTSELKEHLRANDEIMRNGTVEEKLKVFEEYLARLKKVHRDNLRYIQ